MINYNSANWPGSGSFFKDLTIKIGVPVLELCMLNQQ